METDWPRPFLDLYDFTAGRLDGRLAMSGRFNAFVEPYNHLLGGSTVVKVAGTNGKGSVCALLEASLRRDGQRVGMLTSPHLYSITQRFRVDGSEPSLDALAHYAQEVLRAARSTVVKYGESHTPSFFEALILIAILLFYEHKIEVAIIEAGVGGYSDAVSLLPGQVSVITSIGLDHQNQLGDSLEAIAADKAGIATGGSHLIISQDIPAHVRAVIEADAKARGIDLCRASLAGIRASVGNLDHPTRITVTFDGEEMDLCMPLLGQHQVNNFATVKAAIEVMTRKGFVSSAGCLKGVEDVRWPGRLDVRQTKPRIILDCAHNEQAIRALVDSLRHIVPMDQRVLIYGASTGKDYTACLPYLPLLAPEVYFVGGFYRAEQTATIATQLPPGCHYAGDFSTPRQCVEFFFESSLYSERVLIVTGSVFLVGALMECLDRPPATAEAERATDKLNSWNHPVR